MTSLHLESIRTSFRTDTCKRLSSCSICPRPILKDEIRFVVHHYYSVPITLVKGGRISYRDYFFHPSCFADLLDEPSEPTPQCYDCRKAIAQGRVNNWTPVAWKWYGYTHIPLCSDCATQPRWRYCDTCKLHHPRHKTSPILSDGLPSGHFACDDCTAELDLLTVKVRKRLRRKVES